MFKDFIKYLRNLLREAVYGPPKAIRITAITYAVPVANKGVAFIVSPQFEQYFKRSPAWMMVTEYLIEEI